VANSRSARERIRSNERKHVHNRGIRASVRTKVAKARRALLEGDAAPAAPEEQLRLAVSALDRAGSKGVLHPRNVARRKSRLMHLANTLLAAAAGTDQAQTAARATAVGGEKGRTARGAAKRKPAAAKTAGVGGSAARRAATAKAAATGRAAAKTAAGTAADRADGAPAKPAVAKPAARRTSSRSGTRPRSTDSDS